MPRSDQDRFERSAVTQRTVERHFPNCREREDCEGLVRVEEARVDHMCTAAFLEQTTLDGKMRADDRLEIVDAHVGGSEPGAKTARLAWRRAADGEQRDQIDVGRREA